MALTRPRFRLPQLPKWLRSAIRMVCLMMVTIAACWLVIEKVPMQGEAETTVLRGVASTIPPDKAEYRRCIVCDAMLPSRELTDVDTIQLLVSQKTGKYAGKPVPINLPVCEADSMNYVAAISAWRKQSQPTEVGGKWKNSFANPAKWQIVAIGPKPAGVAIETHNFVPEWLSAWREHKQSNRR